MVFKTSPALALVLGINMVTATPTTWGDGVSKRQSSTCPNGQTCPDGQIWWAVVDFYSDDACMTSTGSECYCAGNNGFSSGEYTCNPGDIPSGSSYGMLTSAYNSNVQIDYTGDQSCPPSGPGAVEATLIDNTACVAIANTDSGVGVSMYPNGGAPIAGPSHPEIPSRTRKNKRSSTVTCTGFAATSSTPSESGSQQVSPIVDCSTSASPCPITTSEQNTTTTSSTYSGTIGGSIGEIFGISASATFGQGYSDSESSSIQEGFSVDVGQNGYLTAYCTATLYYGTYSGCSGDSSTIDGEVLALHSNGFTYELVNTGA